MTGRNRALLVVVGAVTAAALSAGTLLVLAQVEHVPCTDASASFAGILDYAQGTRGLPPAEAAEHALRVTTDRGDPDVSEAFIAEAERILRAGGRTVSVGHGAVTFERARGGWRASSFVV